MASRGAASLDTVDVDLLGCMATGDPDSAEGFALEATATEQRVAFRS